MAENKLAVKILENLVRAGVIKVNYKKSVEEIIALSLEQGRIEDQIEAAMSAQEDEDDEDDEGLPQEDFEEEDFDEEEDFEEEDDVELGSSGAYLWERAKKGLPVRLQEEDSSDSEHKEHKRKRKYAPRKSGLEREKEREAGAKRRATISSFLFEHKKKYLSVREIHEHFIDLGLMVPEEDVDGYITDDKRLRDTLAKMYVAGSLDRQNARYRFIKFPEPK